jgi:hypothetical protein
MSIYFYSATIWFLFLVQQSIYSLAYRQAGFYARARNRHELKLQVYILVKQYQVCRVSFYRVAGTGSHWYVKTFSPASLQRSPSDRLCILPLNAAHIVAAYFSAMHLPTGRQASAISQR